MAREGDTIGWWMEQASRYPLLPKAEVLRLAKIVHDPKASEAKRKRAVDKIVLHNLKLIPKVVRAFCGKTRSYNYGDANTVDFMQMGVIGLRRAAEKFDPERGYAFSTYAVPWIRQAMQREAFKNLSNIRVPESTLREVFELNRNYFFNRPMEVPEAKWHRLTDAFFAINCNSIDAPMSSCEDVDNWHEAIASLNHGCKEPMHSFDEILCDVDITDQERLILKRYYMENTTFTDIAKEIGICRETVRKKIERLIRSIRKQKLLH